METRALDQLVKELGPRLYRYFLSRFTEPDSSDLTQETLIRLIRKIREGAFDPQKGSVAMFAFGIAHYVALEFRKKRSLVISEEAERLESAEGSPEDHLMAVQHTTALRNAISQLTPIQQEVLGLMVDEEMTLNAIAAILGLPEGTIKSHIHRAKTRLTQLLKTPRGAIR